MPLFDSPATQINTPSSSSLDRRGLAQVLGQGLISAEDTDNVDGLCTTRVKRKIDHGLRGLVDSFKKLRFDDKEVAAAYLTQRMTRLFSSELQRALTEEDELPNVIDLTLDDESVDPDQEAIPPTPPTPQPPVIEVYDSDEDEEEMQEEENNEDAETVVLPISTTMQTCSSAESKTSTVSELQRNWDFAMEHESESSSSDDEEYEPTEVPTILDDNEDIDVWPCTCGAKTWKNPQGVEYCSVSGVPFQECTDDGNGTCICGRNSKHGTCQSSNKAVPICDLPKVE